LAKLTEILISIGAALILYAVKLPNKLTELGHEQCHAFSGTDDLIISTWPLLHVHMKSMCCHLQQQQTVSTGWLVGRLTSPFSTQIGYIGDNDLGGKRYSNLPTSLLLCSVTTQNGKR